MTTNIISPWTPESNPNSLRVLGKTLEELTECGSAVARCLVQGIDESEPVTGKPNREWLLEEVADAYAVLDWTVDYFKLDIPAIAKRSARKQGGFRQWLAMTA
jgi:hypothetical protein